MLVVPEPVLDVFTNVPPFMKVAPPVDMAKLALSWSVKVAPGRLLIIAPLLPVRVAAPAHVPVEALVRVRLEIVLFETPLKASPPLATVCPVPVMLPDTQLSMPVTERLPAP